MFRFKNYTLNFKKGHFLGVVNFGGASAPLPPDSTALEGQMRKIHGTISRFWRSYKGPNVKG